MYLANDLITSVKRRCNVPTSQVTFQLADFLALADEEIRSKLVPLVLKHMEEFYVAPPLDQPIVANQSVYAIPTRAIAMALRDVMIVSITDQDSRIPLERLNPEDLYTGLSGNVRYLIKKSGFYLQGNSLILYPTPAAAENNLRMLYCMRPNQLVDVATCGLISAIDTTLNTVTVATLPSNITTSTLVDFVKASPGFECTAIDQTITNIASTVLSFTSLPSNLSVGDYVCQAQQSCVVQVPVELQPLLFQYVVVRVLSAQGDNTNLKAAIAELESIEKAAGLLLAPRVTGKTKRVVNARAISRWV